MRKLVLLVVASSLVLGGCVGLVRNAANKHCDRRVHSDRERCLQNNMSNYAAVAARYGTEQESKEAWATQTLKGLEDKAGK